MPVISLSVKMHGFGYLKLLSKINRRMNFVLGNLVKRRGYFICCKSGTDGQRNFKFKQEKMKRLFSNIRNNAVAGSQII